MLVWGLLAPPLLLGVLLAMDQVERWLDWQVGEPAPFPTSGAQKV